MWSVSCCLFLGSWSGRSLSLQTDWPRGRLLGHLGEDTNFPRTFGPLKVSSGPSVDVYGLWENSAAPGGNPHTSFVLCTWPHILPAFWLLLSDHVALPSGLALRSSQSSVLFPAWPTSEQCLFLFFSLYFLVAANHNISPVCVCVCVRAYVYVQSHCSHWGPSVLQYRSVPGATSKEETGPSCSYWSHTLSVNIHLLATSHYRIHYA